MNVTEHLDTSKAVSSNLDSGGGTVTAKGSDGVMFTLTIPSGALLVAQRITVTPVAAIDGLPFHGGFTAAVHLEPDGLTLFSPAMLTITQNKPPPTGYGRIGFEYQGGGTGLHFYPIEEASGLQFKLMHFTSPGIGSISRQDVNNQLGHPPTDNLAQIEQDIAALNETQRQLILLGNGQTLSTAELTDRYNAALAAYERIELNPAIDAATKNGAPYEVVITALNELSAWERDSLLVSGPQPDYPGLVARIEHALPALYKDQVNACFTKHDVRAALRAFALVRYDQLLLGGDLNLPLDPIDRCLRFKLDFEIQIKAIHPTFTGDAHLSATGVPVQMFYADHGGSAPLSYLSFSWTEPTPSVCTLTTSTKVTEDFRVLGINGLELDYQAGQQWDITDFFLDLTPGKADETLILACPGRTAPTPVTFYNDQFEFLHSDEHVERTKGNPPVPAPELSFYAISGWTQTGGHLFARKTYQRTAHYSIVSVTETTTFDLWHEPEGSGIA